MTSVSQELIDIVHGLVDAKTELNRREIQKKLRTDQKIYLKLSDIERQLSRIECHSNVTRKYTKLQTNLIYHLVKVQRPTYDDKSFVGWWKEYCQIVD